MMYNGDAEFKFSCYRFASSFDVNQPTYSWGWGVYTVGPSDVKPCSQPQIAQLQVTLCQLCDYMTCYSGLMEHPPRSALYSVTSRTGPSSDTSDGCDCVSV